MHPCRSALGHGFRWLSVLVAALIAGCAGGADPSAGKSELNVIVPDGGTDSIDIGTVEYTIQCDGNADTFLGDNSSFPDEVLLNGNLEVTDGQTSGGVPTEIWQAFMDLPPGPCLIQLRARDNDGEVICVADDTFAVAADTTTKINLVLVCNISFQAPVGMADVDATFSFVVGNFCPDRFVLNCVESNPVPPGIPGVPPTTYCETRFRDGDSTCGNNCDPQSCDNTVIPPVCTPGPDPGVSTTVTCTGDAFIDCDGDGTPDPSCTWSGDTTGVTGAPPPAFPGDPGAGNFFLSCIPASQGGFGGIVTCTAVTTDGDLDCDKTKTVDVACPSIDPFCELVDCDDGNDCTDDVCDSSSGTGVCVNDPSPSGTSCDAGTGPGSGVCDGDGACATSFTLPAGTFSTTWSDGDASVFITVLNSTIVLELDVTLTVVSDGNNNITTDWEVTAFNPLLGALGMAAEVGGFSIGAAVTGASPSFIPSALDPSVSGEFIGAFLNEVGDTLTLSSPEQITQGTATLTPTGGPVTINWDGDYTLVLTLGGQPLVTLTQDVTSFDVDGVGIDFSNGPCSPSATPPPPANCLDDGNECTADSCDVSSGAAVCINDPVANGTACTSAPTPSGDGSCQAGACLPVPIIAAGSGSTTWLAPTTPPGGGTAPVTGGCVVNPTVLGTTINLDVAITLDVTSDGANNFTTDWIVSASNPLLPALSGAAEYGDLSLNATVTGGLPSAVSSSANPAATGQLLGAFITDTTMTFASPNDITQGSVALTPGAPGVRFNWDGEFSLVLTLGGSPLITIDETVCNFTTQGGDIIIGDVPCAPTANPPPPPSCSDDGNECTVDSCDDTSGIAVCINDPVLNGTPCTDAASLSGLGICLAGACAPAGCTVDGCNTFACREAPTCNASTDQCEPAFPPALPDGTSCAGGIGSCQSGGCIDNCSGVSCSDGDDCTIDGVCDSVAGGVCSPPTVAPDGFACNAGAGIGTGACQAGVCIDNCAGVQCDDANDCTSDDPCNPAGGGVCPSPVALPAGAQCDFGGTPGTCDGAGVCEFTGCLTDADCDTSEPCSFAAPGTCDLGSATCGALTNEPDLLPCDVGDGAGTGRCEIGLCVDNCDPSVVTCDDGDDCTLNLCENSAFPGTCSYPAAPSGTFCDSGSGPNSGLCDGTGVCTALPTMTAGSGSTTWRAATTPPGGGTAPTTGGCSVFVAALNQTVFLDATVTLDVSSDGANNISTAWFVTAANPLLGALGTAAELGGVSIGAVATNAAGGPINSGLNPSVVGDFIGAFYAGANGPLELTTPGAIAAGTATLAPTVVAPGNVNINWDGNFSLSLLLGGSPLVTITGSSCSFTQPGTGVDFAVTGSP